MNRRIRSLAAAVGLVLLLTGCHAGKPGADGEKPNRPWPQTVTYSNLNDEESRELVDRLLTVLPTGEEYRKIFFDHVDQFNSIMKPEELTEGFEEVSITQPKYDSYDLQERWDAEHPEFLGYNCRITAFSLFYPLLHTREETTVGNPDFIGMDLMSLEADPSAIPETYGMKRPMEDFAALYTGVETENTRDVSVHVKNLQENWKDRYIDFEQGGATLISVVFHDQLDGDRLFVGHTGLLFEKEDGLFFLEKLAFQEPYQLVKLNSRAELSDYLMMKYDVEFNQPTAPPFIMENDQLIEGYRPRPEV